ncbi:MAG: cation diffusion facilitator family transporter, partial [Actinobacteria bacterium]
MRAEGQARLDGRCGCPREVPRLPDGHGVRRNVRPDRGVQRDVRREHHRLRRGVLRGDGEAHVPRGLRGLQVQLRVQLARPDAALPPLAGQGHERRVRAVRRRHRDVVAFGAVEGPASSGSSTTHAILPAVSPQRRTALVSVAAAAALIALKLATGLATHSLGLVSEAAHSGTDLVAALLTFFAVGVAGRPADTGHAYGHGKAEHLAALAEAAILVLASLVIAERSIVRLAGSTPGRVHAPWYALVVIGVVLVVDLGRTAVSMRAARRYGSAALSSNALHFASDFAGSAAVLVGLVLVRAGHPRADAVAALFVAVLVLVAAGRLMRRNVDVLMDRAPAEALEAARAAIARLRPPVELRRLRMRQAAGRHFADVVIGVSPGAAVEQGHAAADAVEEAVQRALPASDVVVHVEPLPGDDAIRERARAAAMRVPRVREIHNVSVLQVGPKTEVSLHLK